MIAIRGREAVDQHQGRVRVDRGADGARVSRRPNDGGGRRVGRHSAGRSSTSRHGASRHGAGENRVGRNTVSRNSVGHNKVGHHSVWHNSVLHNSVGQNGVGDDGVDQNGVGQCGIGRGSQDDPVRLQIEQLPDNPCLHGDVVAGVMQHEVISGRRQLALDDVDQHHERRDLR